MTDTTTRVLPSVLPPTEAKLLQWQSLNREQQIARYRDVLLHPDCQRVIDATMDDIRAEAQRRATASRD